MLEARSLTHLLLELSYLEASNAQFLFGLDIFMFDSAEFTAQLYLNLMQMGVVSLQCAYKQILLTNLTSKDIFCICRLLELVVLLCDDVLERLNLRQ